MMKKLTLSIVIPAYNEEDHLGNCLASIAAQNVLPDEVIVVDNNSTDRTAQIAGAFRFVTVVHEPTPGLIAARNTGLAMAQGSLLARINADVILPANWVERLMQTFADQPTAAAIGGVGETKILPSFELGYTIFWSWVYLLSSEAFFGVPILWGANMVLRRSAWQTIMSHLSLDDAKVHEDQDISLCLAEQGLVVVRDNQLRIRTAEQSYYYWPKLWHYLQLRWATKRLHRSPQVASFTSWERTWRYLVVALPMLLFLGTSPLFYPFVWLHRQLRTKRV